MAYVDEENGFYVGNVGNVYEKRTVGKDNRSVVDFSIACTPRYKNESGGWEEGEVTWVNITAWGSLADHVSESLQKGDRVMVKGRQEMKDEYKKDDGTVVPARPFLVAEYVGPELFFNNVTVQRRSSAPRDGSTISPKPKNGSSNGNASNTTTVKKSSKPAAKSDPVDDLDDFDLDGFDDEQPF